LLLCKAFIKDRRLYDEPKGDAPPPLWVRAILLLTCTGVSFAHGSNDGQKGVGLIMLILIGILPTYYALNPKYDAARINETLASVQQIESVLARPGGSGSVATNEALGRIVSMLKDKAALKDIPAQERTNLRNDVLLVDEELGHYEKAQGAMLAEADRSVIKRGRERLRGM